jgi:hypothetical protein
MRDKIMTLLVISHFSKSSYVFCYWSIVLMYLIVAAGNCQFCRQLLKLMSVIKYAIFFFY